MKIAEYLKLLQLKERTLLISSASTNMGVGSMHNYKATDVRDINGVEGELVMHIDGVNEVIHPFHDIMVTTKKGKIQIIESAILSDIIYNN